MGRKANQEATPAEVGEDNEIEDKETNGAPVEVVEVVFQKTCAGPDGTFMAGQRARIPESFAQLLEADNAIKRM